MTTKQIEKELNRQVVLFEKQCKTGFYADNRQTFTIYAAYVLELKKQNGVKHRTLQRYKELLERINPAIGHIKIADIKPQHLNEFYKQLASVGIRKGGIKAIAKGDFSALLKEKELSRTKLAELAGVGVATVTAVCQGEKISEKSAVALASALDINLNKQFTLSEDKRGLSPKTITEHHRLISTILTQAEKEMLIQFNPAAKASPPKIEQKEANYFDEDDIERIRDCLETEPLKWKTALHLLLITGARRGEMLGLKWDKIDFNNNQIHICNNLLYSADIGIYEDTTKTRQSVRYIKLPVETMTLLKEYHSWYLEQLTIYGNKRENSNFLFVQENGKPMNPDTLTDCCRKFSQKYDLPHINPHAFRHTMVSLLYFNGIDSISISRRLGHSKISTTTDKYGHIMKKADEMAADCIADVLFKKNRG